MPRSGTSPRPGGPGCGLGGDGGCSPFLRYPLFSPLFLGPSPLQRTAMSRGEGEEREGRGRVFWGGFSCLSPCPGEVGGRPGEPGEGSAWRGGSSYLKTAGPSTAYSKPRRAKAWAGSRRWSWPGSYPSPSSPTGLLRSTPELLGQPPAPRGLPLSWRLRARPARGGHLLLDPANPPRSRVEELRGSAPLRGSCGSPLRASGFLLRGRRPPSSGRTRAAGCCR